MSEQAKAQEGLNYLVGVATSLPLPLSSICLDMLSDPRFFRGFGSKGKHHAYEGGLVVHTAEVVSHACEMAEQFGADLKVVTTAAILHDYLKIDEYTPSPTGPCATWYREHIRHIAGSFAWFMGKAGAHNLSRDLADKIGHAMLAHHGRIEWGSPVEPATLEAYIVHVADMLSARFGVGVG